MLNNLVVAISGGAGRIGAAFARSVVKNGGKIILGDVNSAKSKQLIIELGEEKAMFYEADLTEPDAIDQLIEKGQKYFGRIDAAVHCAYPISNQWGTRFEDLQADNLEKQCLISFCGVSAITSTVSPRLKCPS